MRPVLRAGSCTGTEASPATLCATHSSGFSSSSPQKPPLLSPPPHSGHFWGSQICVFFFFFPPREVTGEDRAGDKDFFFLGWGTPK